MPATLEIRAQLGVVINLTVKGDGGGAIGREERLNGRLDAGNFQTRGGERRNRCFVCTMVFGSAMPETACGVAQAARIRKNPTIGKASKSAHVPSPRGKTRGLAQIPHPACVTTAGNGLIQSAGLI